METRENFAAPELKEAVGQTVYLSQLEHDATAVIKPYTFMEIGDRVRLTVKTVYGGIIRERNGNHKRDYRDAYYLSCPENRLSGELEPQ